MKEKILSYKEAAKKLNVSLDMFMKYVYRAELAPFRCEAAVKVFKKLKSGVPISYLRNCGGVIFNEKFKKIFNTFINGRRNYYDN